MHQILGKDRRFGFQEFLHTLVIILVKGVDLRTRHDIILKHITVDLFTQFQRFVQVSWFFRNKRDLLILFFPLLPVWIDIYDLLRKLKEQVIECLDQFGMVGTFFLLLFLLMDDVLIDDDVVVGVDLFLDDDLIPVLVLLFLLFLLALALVCFFLLSKIEEISFLLFPHVNVHDRRV